jgi:molybdopterin biosynthesis enzyme
LLADLPANGRREFYQPVRFDHAGATPLQWKGSADIFTLARTDGLLPRPENAPSLAAGARIEVMAIH